MRGGTRHPLPCCGPGHHGVLEAKSHQVERARKPASSVGRPAGLRHTGGSHNVISHHEGLSCCCADPIHHGGRTSVRHAVRRQRLGGRAPTHPGKAGQPHKEISGLHSPGSVLHPSGPKSAALRHQFQAMPRLLPVHACGPSQACCSGVAQVRWAADEGGAHGMLQARGCRSYSVMAVGGPRLVRAALSGGVQVRLCSVVCPMWAKQRAIWSGSSTTAMTAIPPPRGAHSAASNHHTRLSRSAHLTAFASRSDQMGWHRPAPCRCRAPATNLQAVTGMA